MNLEVDGFGPNTTKNVTPVIKNRPEILESMLQDMENAPGVYRPTHHWSYYQSESYKYIKLRGITEFRSNENISWSSFAAVSDPVIGRVRRLMEPIVRAENNKLVKVLLKVISKIPVLKKGGKIWTKTNRMVEHLIRHYEEHLRMLLELSYHYCRLGDDSKTITQISDSGLGKPNIIMNTNGKNYTLPFLRYFLQYRYLSRFVDFRNIDGIIEIGGGYGGFAEVILKLHPHLLYVNVDIPPQIYIAQQYLEACFPGKVFGYEESQNIGKFHPRDYYPEKQIFTLCPWQLPWVEGDFDLFVNSASFQEMEPHVVENYVASINRLVTKYCYLRARPKGFRVAQGSDKQGVLQSVAKEHYVSYFDNFELIDESISEMLPELPGYNGDYQDMFFVYKQ